MKMASKTHHSVHLLENNKIMVHCLDSKELNHQLRTPISCILGLVKILEGDNLTKNQLHFIKDIEHCSHQLLSIIEILITELNCNPIHQTKPLHILLVEDEPILQKAMKFLLQQEGHHVDLASNGKEALQKFNPNYDLIFMDVRMPEMNGIETTKAIRQLETYKHVPIIALTAEGMEIKEEC